ncbi:hypothetical protein NHP190002_09980 [Helicobacter ailurogastricus]|nr:hypothetical protein NHP190002_09980 [Helicobacter ailurogastricus]
MVNITFILHLYNGSQELFYHYVLESGLIKPPDMDINSAEQAKRARTYSNKSQETTNFYDICPKGTKTPQRATSHPRLWGFKTPKAHEILV